MGKFLIIAGISLVILGLLVTFWNHIPPLGRLPGDITFHKGNSTFYFPIVTSIIISLILTVVINVVLRIIK